MTERCQKKNYYFLKTILQEIKKYDVISFNIYDTLILRNTLFPQDIFKLLANIADEQYGVKDFNFIRINMEAEARNRTVQTDGTKEDISLDRIYQEISAHYPDIPTEQLKEAEINLELQYCRVNPLVKSIYDAAVIAEKKVFLIADTVFPENIVASILNKCGCQNWSGLYLSGEAEKAKSTGSLYRRIIEVEGVDVHSWLHIGENPHSDMNIPRSMGITAGFCRCPRDWFFMERARLHEKKVAESSEPVPETPLDDSIAFSLSTAEDINVRFTETSVPVGDEVISCRDVSMMFNMSKEKVDNLKEYVIRFLKNELSFSEFWALNNVSFSVLKGEKVGLVGLNGSGKSTMLKVVSGVLKPTRGSVSVSGSIAPMIELGAGFDFELSARENVFLNGAILGYDRKQMEGYYDDIISFSELAAFQDVAIKNFSSGMISRLGFAIATCRVPDVLIIDEILSVGDFEFQKKCHRRMEQLTEKGTTVLFVSHSAGDIVNMCDRAIWLDHGNVVAEGEAQYIVEKYLNK